MRPKLTEAELKAKTAELKEKFKEASYDLTITKASEECRRYLDDPVLRLCRPNIEAIVKSGEPHIPVMLVFPKHNAAPALVDVQGALGVPFGDTATKNAVASAQNTFIKLRSTRACVFITEVWTLSKENPTEEVRKLKSIHDHPERQEAIMLNMLYQSDDRQQMQFVVMYPIKRPENTLGEAVIMDPHNLEDKMSLMAGRFVPEQNQH